MRWNPFRRSAPSQERTPSLWLWAPVYILGLSLACWLVTSCSSDGPARRSDAVPPVVAVAWSPPPGATFVGKDVCAGCHDKEAKAFEKSHHGKKNDPRTPAAKQECETCHGPGSVHAEAGGGKGTGNIRTFTKDSPLSAPEKAAVCLQCHEKMWPEWKNGKHATRGLACMDCHKVHGEFEHHLEFQCEPDVCLKCHKAVSAELARQSHHPIREGKMKCSDCHNPHGSSTADKNIKANSVNELCYKCHTEKRGPFMWEHPPVVENCLNCHTPHGTQHDKMLTTDRPFICQRCHSNSRHPGTIYDNTTSFRGTSPGDRFFAAGCVNCHSNIHGSNHPSGKFFMR